MLTLWMARRCASLAVAVTVTAAVPGAQAQPAVTTESLVGVWQFHPPPCATDNGMGLGTDGSAWITDSLHGTWRLDGSVLRFTVDEYDSDSAYNETPTVIARNVQMAAQLLTVQPDYLELRWDNGHMAQAWRCR